jgi:excisionase family DNA binding protein
MLTQAKPCFWSGEKGNSREQFPSGTEGPKRVSSREGWFWSEGMETQTLIQKLGRMGALLDSKQVIGMLGVHICTLQAWTREGQIPFLKVGRTVRFDPGQLANWLEKRQIGA